MAEFKRIYGVRASLSRAGLARISRSNKLPVGFQGVGTIKLRRRRVVTGVFVLALCLLILSGVANGVKADPVARDFVPGQVVAELAPGVSIQQINRTYGTTKIGQIPNSNLYLFELQDGSSVANTVKKMGTDTKRVVFAEPNFVVDPPMGNRRHRAFGISDAQPSPLEDAASALNLSIARNISQGQGTTVAVLDTGMQLDHPALKDNLVEEAKRYDFVDNDTNPSDTPVGLDEDGNGLEDEMVGHGTHVAGIVDLVAPKAKIMPLRVLDTEGYGDVFTIAKAISFATSNGANVINLSLGSPNQSRLLQKVIKDANLNKQNRVLVAAAAGNSNSSTPYYPAAGGSGAPAAGGSVAPASPDGLVAVSSVNSYGQKSDFANYGKWVDIAAPGESIRSAFPISEYAYWSGTSMSTPFVSGEAALIHSVSPSLTPVGVEQRIYCSARPLTATDPVYGAMLGAGHADVGASLTPDFCKSSAPPWTTITAGPWGPTNTASAMFGFASSEAGSTFECKLDNEDFKSCTSPKSVPDVGILAEGTHTFEVRATDANGKTDATPASRTWTVDTAAPDTTIAANSKPPSFTNSTSASFSFTSTEAGSSFQCSLDGAQFTSCTSPQNLTGLSDGSHTFSVRAIDATGNTDGSADSYTWTVDTAAPNTTIDTKPANPSNSASASFTFSSTENGSSFECKLDNEASFTSCPAAGKSYTNLSDGSHTFSVRAIDATGNTDGSADSYTWTVDSTAPVVESVAPQDGSAEAVVSANVSAMFSEAMDADTIDANTFTLTKQGTTTPINAAVSYDAQAKKATLTLDPDADLEASTTYTATIKGGTNGAKDVAGNALANDKVWSFTTAGPADTTPPETTIDTGPSGTVNVA